MKRGGSPPAGKRARGRKWLTAARQQSLRNMGEVARGWGELEEWEREEWRKRAKQERVRIRRKLTPENADKPRSRAMRGQELYVKINRVLAQCGYERRRLPPPSPRFGPNPVTAEVKISRAQGRWVIKVGVQGAPVNDIMVFGAPPRRAGQGPGGSYAFLCLLPPPKNGESEISEPFLTKLKEWRKVKDARYHVPLEGARICIRTWPQDNGWEGKGRMMISQGLAPRAG